MFYLLPLGNVVQLQQELKTEGIMDLQSAKLDLSPIQTSQIDNTYVNLLSAAENILLHISIRRAEKAIVFNSRTKNGQWGPEERVSLSKLQGPDPTITVYDHGDRFQVLMDYATVIYFNKRINENAKMVSYNLNEGQVSPLSDTLAVNTYSSFADIMPRTGGGQQQQQK